jgi:N-acetylmuramoyl-L-alanine amidase
MKFFICVGHANYGNGTISSADGTSKGGVNEYKYNKELAPYVCKWLQAAGHEAVLCIAPEGKLHSLNEEINYFIGEEHEQAYDLSVQLHLNAFNGKAYGCEAYAYNNAGLQVAQQICAKLGTVWHNRGAKIKTGLYWTRKTKAKAVLIESFFCDNKDDYAKAQKLGMDAHGKLIAEGILGKDIVIAPAQKFYIQAGAYKSKENADAQITALEKKGFKASIRKVSGSILYRVQVGTYATKEDAAGMLKWLKAAGFAALLKEL